MRQPDLTVVLENVHDPHNIAAVLRSCDSVGVKEIYVLYTEPHLQQSMPVLGKRSSAGSRKWLDVHVFEDLDTCFQVLKGKYKQILGTHLGASSKSLYQFEFLEPTALVFGNEHDGLSENALRYCTGNFRIPQVGMVASLNISVACAVSLYEVFRQRNKAGFYAPPYRKTNTQTEKLIDDYLSR